MPEKFKKMYWKCHTPNLLNEILVNDQCSILKRPFQIFENLLGEVAQRAQELDDPKLDLLMCRLTLYTVADPEHEDYDKKVLKELERHQ